MEKAQNASFYDYPTSFNRHDRFVKTALKPLQANPTIIK